MGKAKSGRHFRSTLSYAAKVIEYKWFCFMNTYKSQALQSEFHSRPADRHSGEGYFGAIIGQENCFAADGGCCDVMEPLGARPGREHARPGREHARSYSNGIGRSLRAGDRGTR